MIVDKIVKRRSTAINPALPFLIEDQNQQQTLKTEAKSHQDSISKGSNPIPKERVELMLISTNETPSTELIDQSQENLESKSNLENETSLSNLQSTHLEVDNDTITPRDRSYSKAYQMKSAVIFLFYFFLNLIFFFLFFLFSK